MTIKISSEYSNPINVGFNMVTKLWASLPNSPMSTTQDWSYISKGEHVFVMDMEDGEKVIGTVEKGFELITKAHNLCLHINNVTVCVNYAHTIFQDIFKESYYIGKTFEFLTLTKLGFIKDVVFLTLATKEARGTLQNHEIFYHHDKVKLT